MATLVNFVPVFCLPRCPLRHCRPLSSLATHGNSWHGIVQAQFVQELREWYHQKSNKSMWHVWNKTRMVMAYTRPFPSFVAPPLSQWYFPMPSSSAPASVFFPNGPISHYAPPSLSPHQLSPALSSPPLSSSSFPSSSLLRIPLCALDLSPSGQSGHWVVGRALQRPQQMFVAITADPKQAFSLLLGGVRAFEMDPLNLKPFPNLRIILSHPKLVDKFFPVPIVTDVLLSMSRTTGCGHSFTNNHHGIYDQSVAPPTSSCPSSTSCSPFQPTVFSSFSSSSSPSPSSLILSPSLFRHIGRVIPPNGSLHIVMDNDALATDVLSCLDQRKLKNAEFSNDSSRTSNNRNSDAHRVANSNANSKDNKESNSTSLFSDSSWFVCLSPGGYDVGRQCASVLGGVVNSQQAQTVTQLLQHTALYYDDHHVASKVKSADDEPWMEDRTDQQSRNVCGRGDLCGEPKAWGRGRIVIVDGKIGGEKTREEEKEEEVNFCNLDGSISIRIRSRAPSSRQDEKTPAAPRNIRSTSSSSTSSNTSMFASECDATSGASNNTSNVVKDENGLVYYSRWMRTRPRKPNFRLNSQSVITTFDASTSPVNKRPIPLSW
eukprot:GHVS01091798.1.p1 GENE.GHVS01091798.1~~GHVS01091798.1.p1  ORF type:complete len:602 (-),score=92.58 GHVS01091798.1:115-1920(-)